MFIEPLWKTIFKFPSKVKRELSYGSQIILSRLIVTENKIILKSSRYTCHNYSIQNKSLDGDVLNVLHERIKTTYLCVFIQHTTHTCTCTHRDLKLEDLLYFAITGMKGDIVLGRIKDERKYKSPII